MAQLPKNNTNILALLAGLHLSAEQIVYCRVIEAGHEIPEGKEGREFQELILKAAAVFNGDMNKIINFVSKLASKLDLEIREADNVEVGKIPATGNNGKAVAIGRTPECKYVLPQNSVNISGDNNFSRVHVVLLAVERKGTKYWLICNFNTTSGAECKIDGKYQICKPTMLVPYGDLVYTIVNNDRHPLVSITAKAEEPKEEENELTFD